MTMRSGPVSEVTVLVAGAASGSALVLEEPLSFWGGIDPETGRIIDRRHPQLGLEVTGRILVMPIGRGSSSSSTVFAEAIRRGTAPAAVFLHEIDPIVALGAVVAQRLYGTTVPVVLVDPALAEGIRTGSQVDLDESGRVRVSPGTGRPQEGL